jgi:hypothetical protein
MNITSIDMSICTIVKRRRRTGTRGWIVYLGIAEFVVKEFGGSVCVGNMESRFGLKVS